MASYHSAFKFLLAVLDMPELLFKKKKKKPLASLENKTFGQLSLRKQRELKPKLSFLSNPLFVRCVWIFCSGKLAV